MKQQRGFTLVELAIVLVIIGLILGMAFKGKDLIDGAKVKSMAAQYNKMVAGFNIYYDRFGAYPGDGCTAAATPPLGGAAVCTPAGTRSGLLNNAAEATAAIRLLQNSNILSASDLQSIFGVPWSISVAGAVAGNYAANTNYMTPGLAAANAVDLRFVCALDRVIDDGNPTTGVMRSSATAGPVTAAGTTYDATSDCWAATSTVTMGVRVLP